MIYLLQRIGNVNYDEMRSKVVRAASEEEARSLANVWTFDEGKIWQDPLKVSCEVVLPDGEPEVILEDFKAG